MKKEKISEEEKQNIGKEIVFLINEFSNITGSILEEMNLEEIAYFVKTMKDAFETIKKWESNKWIDDLIKDCEKENWGI